MKILLLGGTQFVGKHITQAAIQQGHTITMFNRGQTNQNLFPDIEHRFGDRNGNLTSLEQGEWDAVIDVSGYTPSQVQATASLLKNRTKHYLFISTVSVYDNFANGPAKVDETPLATLDEDTEEVTGSTYGPLKVKCEEAVREHFPNACIVRPGLIVGPDDPTDRFTYWVCRIGRGGNVLAPGHPDRLIQWIDVRDLAEWIIRMVEEGQAGTFNAAGPQAGVTMKDFLEEAKRVQNSDAEITWVEDSLLQEHEIGAFVELPFWIPVSDSYPDGFILTDTSKARAAGLTFRSVADTVSATAEWARKRDEESQHDWKAGLEDQKERSILSKVVKKN